MTDTTIRDAAAADTEAIARIALATGQDEEWSGSDPAYVRHLLAHGRLVVAEHRGAVAGFGATHQIGAGPAAITMLCDLFVDPGCHGLGLGRAMLEVLWHDGTPRMTFSSLHAHALPLYARYGLDAWWPLLYLSGDVTALRAPAGWAVRPRVSRGGGRPGAAVDRDRPDGRSRGLGGPPRRAAGRGRARRPGRGGRHRGRGGERIRHHPPGAAAGLRGRRGPGRGAGRAGVAGPARRPGAGLPACARTRRPGRCWRRAGATTTWTCTWRPSRACSTRAGPSPPPAWPDRSGRPGPPAAGGSLRTATCSSGFRPV